MSNKEKKKNANKSLEALKRKQYARGGRSKPKPRDLFDDSVKEPKLPPKLPTTPQPQPKPKPQPKPSPKPQGEPIVAPPKQTVSDPSGGPQDTVTFTGLDGNEYSTNAELQAANAAFLAAQENNDGDNGDTGDDNINGVEGVTNTGITKEAPTKIVQDAPVASLVQATTDTILNEDGTLPTGTVTSDDDIEKLKDATDATSGEVGIPKGYSTKPKVDKGYPAVMPADGKIFVSFRFSKISFWNSSLS